MPPPLSSSPHLPPPLPRSTKDGVFFVDGGGCAAVLPQQAFRQGARLRLAFFRPPPRNPVHLRDLVQQGRTFAPPPPSSLLSITLTDPFPHLLILQIDVAGWLEAFAADPPIGSISPSVLKWSKEEQSEKFGFVFLICTSGRGSLEILVELKGDSEY
ncbi:hypothetical protein ZIOFF_065077 [Zingiber officinale]|uniref:Uncharacterized protein n=1 Tax=Zingiber officinale TaxID=94328 RepID=A0A8J5KGV3_ZINOF|nr:hypothetical protein ZIOFF_065077 [Zingiber officinale]